MNYYYNKSILFNLLDINIGEKFEYDNINYGYYMGNYKNKYHLFLNTFRTKYININYQKYFFRILTSKEVMSLPTESEKLFIMPIIFNYGVLKNFHHNIRQDINSSKSIITIDFLYYSKARVINEYFSKIKFDYVYVNNRLTIMSINRLIIY